MNENINKTICQLNKDGKLKERFYGIDLLRIISMLMILMLHILGKGGVLTNLEGLTLKYEVAWLLEIISFAAVDIYAMITGFVYYGQDIKVDNLLKLEIQVLFYSVLFTTISVIINNERVSIKLLKDTIFPCISKRYWYFSAYFCMFICIPILNSIIEKFKGEMLIVGGIIFSLLPTVFCSDYPSLNGGYSFIWLVFMYIIGGYIRKSTTGVKVNSKKMILSFLGFVFASWFLRFVYDFACFKFLGETKEACWLITYISPFVVGEGVTLILLFKDYKPHNVRLIRYLAPLCFGVYLIHLHPFVWNNVIADRFSFVGNYNTFAMVILVILCSILVFSICAFIDYIRLLLSRVLHISTACKYISEFIIKAVNVI